MNINQRWDFRLVRLNLGYRWSEGSGNPITRHNDLQPFFNFHDLGFDGLLLAPLFCNGIACCETLFSAGVHDAP